MTKVDHPGRNPAGNGHAAEISIRIGRRATFDAKVTNAGLLSIGALVSGILLSTAVIVSVAGRRKAARQPGAIPDGDGS